ncbi:MAG: protein translocase subunit SecD, partial [bacterium]|nr:protein translocase subunit SecD [bacterium]
RAVAVLSQRINNLGVVEPEIVREGSRRIRISLPGAKDETQEQAMSIIGQTALLEIWADESQDYKVLLSGDSLIDAREKLDDKGKAYVAIKLDDASGKIMREYTTARAKIGYLVFVLDGAPISMPFIEEAVGAEGIITGLGSLEEARNLAIMLRSGALPVSLEIRDFRAVGPSLGRSSLDKSINAGLIGFVLVLLFMIAIYRGFGVVANLALSAYIMIVLWLLAGLNATLTLPGIAGIILGIGMAVDANVIIFERIKEEMSNGRTLRVAIGSGFKRAFWTVFDANITTLIGAGALYYFGTGPVRGFAVTLAISITVSMFTAITVTRLMLFLLVNAKLVKSSKAIGV